MPYRSVLQLKGRSGATFRQAPPTTFQNVLKTIQSDVVREDGKEPSMCQGKAGEYGMGTMWQKETSNKCVATI